MKKIIKNSVENVFTEKEIPKTIHNIALTENQRQRLLKGLKTGLIKGVIFENGKVENVKIQAIKDKENNVNLEYDIQKKSLEIPNKIFNQNLTEEQIQQLYNGELLHLNFKQKDYFIGVDPDLNKITIKNLKEIQIPDKLGRYKLDSHDKQRLANGLETRDHVFVTSSNNYYVGSIKLTEDKKGIEINNIKDLDKDTAIKLSEKINIPMKAESKSSFGDITQEIIRDLEKDSNNSKILKRVSKEGITEIQTNKIFTPKTFKGVQLSEKQIKDFEDFKKITLENAQKVTNGKKYNVTIWKEKEKNSLFVQWKDILKKTKTKAGLTKEI